MIGVSNTNNYTDPELIRIVAEIFKNEMISFNDIRSCFFDVKDIDKSLDLEDVGTEEKVSVNAILLVDNESDVSKEIKDRFPKTIDFLKKMPGVKIASCVAIAPNSIVPLHLDDMDSPAYQLNDWYAVLIGVVVPDPNLVGMKIGDNIYTHTQGTSIIFDTQIPHSAWNKTDDWWVTLRLSTKKEFFKNENIS